MVSHLTVLGKSGQDSRQEAEATEEVCLLAFPSEISEFAFVNNSGPTVEEWQHPH